MSKPADLSLLASAIEVVFESRAYGVFVLLSAVSTVILVRRRRKTRHLFFLLGTIWTMLLLSTLHWCTSLAYLVSQLFDGEVMAYEDSVIDSIAKINYDIADGVLVWRALVLSRLLSQRYRRLIALPCVTLGISIILTIVAIGMRVAVNDKIAGFGSGNFAELLKTLNFTQVGILIFSTATNVLSTGLVGLCVWEHKGLLRASMSDTMSGSTRTFRVLLLLLEPGVIYTAFVFMTIFASSFRVSFGTIGDVTSDLLIPISGIYPTLIITIVTLQHSVVPSLTSFSLPRLPAKPPLPRLERMHTSGHSSTLKKVARHVPQPPAQQSRMSPRGTEFGTVNLPEFEQSTFDDFASDVLQRMQDVMGTQTTL